MLMSRLLFTLAFTAPLAAACTSDVADDELAGDDVTQGDGKADAAGTATYYRLSPDLRACVAPGCGGVYYELANGRSTRCLDGETARRCYAETVDWAALGLDAATTEKVRDGVAHDLVIRATVRPQKNSFGTFAELVPSEAWLAQGPNAVDGPLARIEDTGIRCIQAPCPSLRERKLNSSVTATLAELDWDVSGAPSAQISAGIAGIHGSGLIIAGDRITVTGPGGKAKGRTVTQFWLRAEAAPVPSCVVSGCSGQICADRPMASTCEFLPEYACYDTAACEVQADGACGWTQTDELAACIADARE